MANRHTVIAQYKYMLLGRNSSVGSSLCLLHVEGVVLVIVVSIINSSTEFSVPIEHAVKKSMKIKDFFIILKIKNY